MILKLVQRGGLNPGGLREQHVKLNEAYVDPSGDKLIFTSFLWRQAKLIDLYINNEDSSGTR
jgi:hypothetical protein